MPALKPGEALWLEQMEKNGLVDIAARRPAELGRLAKYQPHADRESRRAIPAAGQDNALLTTQHRRGRQPRAQ